MRENFIKFCMHPVIMVCLLDTFWLKKIDLGLFEKQAWYSVKGSQDDKSRHMILTFKLSSKS